MTMPNVPAVPISHQSIRPSLLSAPKFPVPFPFLP
jgi:hypothetical protein